jgi:hypothetical protein
MLQPRFIRHSLVRGHPILRGNTPIPASGWGCSWHDGPHLSLLGEGWVTSAQQAGFLTCGLSYEPSLPSAMALAGLLPPRIDRFRSQERSLTFAPAHGSTSKIDSHRLPSCGNDQPPAASTNPFEPNKEAPSLSRGKLVERGRDFRP